MYRFFGVWFFVFFFKQKTAYEMRISDWSSDVCSSDLFLDRMAVQGSPRRRLAEDHERHEPAPRRRPFRRPAHDPRRLRPDPRRLTGGLSTRHPRPPSRGSRASDRTVALDARVKPEHNG